MRRAIAGYRQQLGDRNAVAANDVALQRLEGLLTRRSKAVNERLMGLRAGVEHTRAAVDKERREIVRSSWVTSAPLPTPRALLRMRMVVTACVGAFAFVSCMSQMLVREERRLIQADLDTANQDAERVRGGVCTAWAGGLVRGEGAVAMRRCSHCPDPAAPPPPHTLDASCQMARHTRRMRRRTGAVEAEAEAEAAYFQEQQWDLNRALKQLDAATQQGTDGAADAIVGMLAKARAAAEQRKAEFKAVRAIAVCASTCEAACGRAHAWKLRLLCMHACVVRVESPRDSTPVVLNAHSLTTASCFSTRRMSAKP